MIEFKELLGTYDHYPPKKHPNHFKDVKPPKKVKASICFHMALLLEAISGSIKVKVLHHPHD